MYVDRYDQLIVIYDYGNNEPIFFKCITSKDLPGSFFQISKSARPTYMKTMFGHSNGFQEIIFVSRVIYHGK